MLYCRYINLISYLCKMKKKNVFRKVEIEAKAKLNDPDTKGAAQTVLEYINEHKNDP